MDKNIRLLVISNNPFSYTGANGKTIMSFFDSVPKNQIRQLYFNSGYPTVKGYKYFQIKDTDIVHGFFCQRKRGRAINEIKDEPPKQKRSTKGKKQTIMRILREIVWMNKWRSKQLIEWLDDYNPTAIFLVGGDCGFAYDICLYIKRRYNSRLSTFITDDYILPRKMESPLSCMRRLYIKKKLKNCLLETDCFVTISEKMKRVYKKILKKDSIVAVNIPEPINTTQHKTTEPLQETNNKELNLIYAGGLNYGRGYSLRLIGLAIKKYNKMFTNNKAYLRIYSKDYLDKEQLNMINIEKSSHYCGGLNKEELNKALLNSDILVYVESFDNRETEKVRLSLSTKIPEYLSMQKPIFAVGPNRAGSIQYLNKVAICCHSENEIFNSLCDIINKKELRMSIAQKAYKKYLEKHNKEQNQKCIKINVLGL